VRPRPQPVWQEPAVTLRLFRDEDVPDVVEACRDPETQRWTTLTRTYAEPDARQFLAYAASSWASGLEGVWAMCLPGEARWSGSISLRLDRFDRELGDVGFLAAPWARGRGLTSAALHLVCGFGFAQLGLERIEWRAHIGNEASRRVAEKVGFQLEGVQRARLVQRGERRDAWVASLLPGDLRDPASAGPAHEGVRR
jgi:RimJ/RimL family protein N-acetyltransferase